MDTKTLMEWSAKYHTPNYGRTPIVLVRGEGTRVWDSDGKEYLDFTTGIAVTSLGHCHPVITGAIREAAATLLHVSNIFHTAPQVHLAKMLVEHSFADRVFFCNSGAEANEAALKIARKYGKERLASDRYEIIATNNSFHGRTLATVTATGQPKYHHGFEPLMPGFKHVPYNDLRAMERAMDSRTAAILVEPIQGEGGVNIPDDGYLPGLRKLCDESGALLIFDEVQTGVGRTGRWFAHQRPSANEPSSSPIEPVEITPDIVTIAKGLGGGFPIGACIGLGAAATLFEPGNHGTTFGGNPVACAAALAVLDEVAAPAFRARAEEVGGRIRSRLDEFAGRNEHVGEVRGLGPMLAFELVESRESRAPAGELAQATVAAAFERGLILLSCGLDGNVIRVLVPLVVSDADLDRGLDLLEESLGAAAGTG
jgi:acetylornithine/N-succinyldiaminopimelate aminotransferase